MEVGWISAIMDGSNIDPLNEEEAVILLPTGLEQIEEYEQQHPDAFIVDLQDNQVCFQRILRNHDCSVLDLISQDCSLKELNTFLATANQLTHEQFETGVCSLLELKQQRSGGKLSTEDMLEQVKRWEDMRYCPISPKQFTELAGQLMPECSQEALKTWVAFAKECVDLEQYVDFKTDPDRNEAVGRWLETLLVGLYISKIRYGEEAAEKVCSLGQLEKPMCLYPSEILQAAVQFEMGCSQEEVTEMVKNGEIDACIPFFPKSCDYKDLAEIIDQKKVEESEEERSSENINPEMTIM